MPHPRGAPKWILISALVIAAAQVAVIVIARDRSANRAAPAPPPFPILEQAEPAARQVIEQAMADVEAAPDSAPAWLRLGMINEAYLQFEPARQCYEQSLNLDEAQPHAWYHLGLMATELGDLTSGVAAMRRCIEHEPNYAPAHWRLGLWLIDLARMDEAEQAFRRAMAVNPRDPAGAMGMARVMLERGEAEPAAVLLEALLAANPPNAAYAWQLLATAYRHLGREADAREAAGRGQGADVQWIDDWQYEVVQLRRDKAWRRDLALALAAQGRLPDAILIMEETAVSHPDDLDLLLHLAALLREARRDTQALALLDRVERSASLLLESRPQDAEAREALERARALRGAGAGSP